VIGCLLGHIDVAQCPEMVDHKEASYGRADGVWLHGTERTERQRKGLLPVMAGLCGRLQNSLE
jgi:hypothetical protein